MSEYQRAYAQKHSARKSAKATEWNRANPGRRRCINFKYRYGISVTPEDYDRMLVEQGGVCALCDKPETTPGRSLAIDHDHKSRIVRGLLCYGCNAALGRLERVGLTKIEKYLRRGLEPLA